MIEILAAEFDLHPLFQMGFKKVVIQQTNK